MNCERLRELLYDYLDNSLSRSDKAAVERHLAECLVCHEAVRRESRLAQSLSTRLEQAVETVTLDAPARRHMVSAVERELAHACERPPAWFWKRLALPFATAAVVLGVAIWLGYYFRAQENSHSVTERLRALDADRDVLMHLSYFVPRYTFQREGNEVIDALTSDTLVAEGALLVRN